MAHAMLVSMCLLFLGGLVVEKSMRLAILECYAEEREFVVLDTLDAACMRLGYYLEVFKQELKRGLICE